MKELKRFTDLAVPDQRQLGWKIKNHETGAVRDLTLEEHYKGVEAMTLGSQVPDDVRGLFNTARNLFLYSWYVFRFGAVAEIQAYSTLEYALRKRLNPCLPAALGWLDGKTHAESRTGEGSSPETPTTRVTACLSVRSRR